MIRGGFVLVHVLWIVAGLSIVASVTAVIARDAGRASINGTHMTQDLWHAEGCIDAALARIFSRISDPTESEMDVWRHLDALLGASDFAPPCQVGAVPVGTTLDLNTTAPDIISRVLMAHGFGRARADSMVLALVRWRGDATPDYADDEYYQSTYRERPRRAPLQSAEELLLVRGFHEDSALLRLFGVDSAGLLLDRLDPVILSGLPGLSSEAVDWIVAARLRGEAVTLGTLLSDLSGAARDSLSLDVGRLSALVGTVPDRWHITARVGRDYGTTVSLRATISLQPGLPRLLSRNIRIGQ